MKKGAKQVKTRSTKNKKEAVPVTQAQAQRSVVLPDIHHPYHDRQAWAAVLEFLKWFKPHQVILNGDAMNMDSANHWAKSKGNLRQMENKRIAAEYDEFSEDILEKIERAVPGYCRLVYMGGNHEDWIEQVIDKDPRLMGSLEVELRLHLKQRGWEWIPPSSSRQSWNVTPSFFRIGKLLVMHGMYTNKYHAAKTVGMLSRSVIYGHTHDIQVYTEAHIDDPRSYHTAQSIGCLCKMAPPYMKGKANRWVNAFAVVLSRPSGDYNLYVPVIVKGQFSFGGKTFGKK